MVVKVNSATSSGSISSVTSAAIAAREKALLPVYQQVARAFADMHDTPVRMLAKGVIRSIVPWARARAFFVTRLRRRLAEETLAGHVQSTDASVNREEALSMIQGWYDQASSLSGSSPSNWSAQFSINSPNQVSSERGEGAPDENPPLTSAASHNQESVDGTSSLFQRQQLDDLAFLEWSESSPGRSMMAAELRSLRSRSASRIVSQVLGSAEGKEGLLRSLQAASKRDPVFAMQLRMSLNDGGSGSRSVLPSGPLNPNNTD